MKKYYDEVEQLTLELVKIKSINNSEGEREIAEKIYEYISSMDYFKTNKDLVWSVPLKNDPYGRINVFALIKGKKGISKKTIIIHGHMDTVGVEDFGELAPYAFNPLELQEKLKELKLDEEVRRDLASGDWMFGRGVTDMKSGVAAHLAALKELSTMAEELEGNILFTSNPVEENQHTGIIEALEVLTDLKSSQGLEYALTINNDFTSPLYEGDNNKYVYVGAAGKLLPCFFIFGKETHVGQCFEGLDPNLIASELFKLIDFNTELCDEYEGEYTVPPTSLKLKDLKLSYNVQTPCAAYMYFNYFVHNISVKEVVEILKQKGEEAFNNAINYLNSEYEKYCYKVKKHFTKLPWKSKVITFDQLYNEVKIKLGDKLDEEINTITKELKTKGNDARELCLKIVERVKQLSEDKDPVIILFFSPPYCPHNTLKSNNIEEDMLLKSLEAVLKDFAALENMKDFKILRFFPSLSDSSYLKVDDDYESIDTLVNNFPNWEKIYNIPIKEIKNLNIPAVNFGTYGKDAHKWIERVYKPYTFETLPRLTVYTIKRFLENSLEE
ncbi:peptidase M20 [Clostridium polyendosporum]|uniref:Peptidase M20 n=1 Tax=Clostridium polyendosporum TaxID=69208 RepID=A0A919RXJ5_9CLOT|nr:M20/M25/M40 family metallo-hydrolase [Clostridium polyendosporum]GIM27596.1 peptidase M20 [Clostridium polyendosporum]